ncbi:MAG: alpha/beta fold hydrolase [Paludibacteraceae bacterium]|nr:alpha/beta fold hydrolase [Paludibacteraceae bacterium]MBR6492365.1 alpha/beta fold hydrolase [Paludibacteraceae bacterium]
MIKLLLILSVLPAILAGDFKPQTLTIEEQDSILAIGVPPEEGVSTRYHLECENEEQLFRHSSYADWFVIDSMRHTRKRLGEGLNLGKVRDAVMSPNGRYVAFAKDNNLYIHKLDFGTEVAVTKDENTDIINGVADWLYEEEFGTTALFAWSPDSKQLAFVKLDEREVPTFSWQMFVGPQYPQTKSLRYPKAGCPNAKASVCIYDVPTKGIVSLPVNPKGEDVYFPRIRWYKDDRLFVVLVNRDQTKMEVLDCNSKSTVVYPWYHEESKEYFIDYSLFDEWLWLSDGRIIVLTEQEGWRQAYLYGNDGIKIKALTPEGMDVTALYAVDEKTQSLYYQAATTPATRDIYGLNLKKGVSTKITDSDGMYSARFSNDGSRAIICFQSFTTPNKYILWSKNKCTPILDNKAIQEAWQANNLPEPQLLHIPNKNGQLLEAMLLSPLASSPSPLVLMHYSGPASQRVLNRWRKRFEYALVEAGYAVLIVDPRGSDCRGREWRNETYMNLGQKEAEDLIAAAENIGQRDDIDASRMAILGWSYGGYQTLFTMSQPNHPFKAGVAIAPVTDWRLYDSAYTERYMRRPQVNDRGYQSASLLPRVEQLSGTVLIIHGTGDDNVHVQHTMQYIDALVQVDKQFEMQLYPDDNHHLRKGNNALHMHNRVLRFLEKSL